MICRTQKTNDCVALPVIPVEKGADKGHYKKSLNYCYSAAFKEFFLNLWAECNIKKST